MRRRGYLATIAFGIALIGGSPGPRARPVIVWNASASATIGLYRVVSTKTIRVGDLVIARPPLELASLFAERGYLPAGVPLLKRIAAMAGSVICRQGLDVSIDGRVIVRALANDRIGRLLPVWSGCWPLSTGEVFLLMADVPASLDGRYFGATPTSSIIGKAVPLWTWPAS